MKSMLGRSGVAGAALAWAANPAVIAPSMSRRVMLDGMGPPASQDIRTNVVYRNELPALRGWSTFSVAVDRPALSDHRWFVILQALRRTAERRGRIERSLRPPRKPS